MPNDNALRENLAELCDIVASIAQNMFWMPNANQNQCSVNGVKAINLAAALRQPPQEVEPNDASLPKMSDLWGIAPNATVLPCCDAEEQLTALRAAVAPLVERAKRLSDANGVLGESPDDYEGEATDVLLALSALDLGGGA